MILKPLLKAGTGIALIIFSLISLPMAFYQVTPRVSIDLPCEERLEVRKIDNPRIGYCLNLHPIMFTNGSRISESGASSEDTIAWDAFKFRRSNRILLLGSHSINPGETYQTTRWKPSLNPWLILTVHYVITNEGIISMGSNQPSNMLYVSGNAIGGWHPNPFGLFLLGVGVWLFVKGNKERKQA